MKLRWEEDSWLWAGWWDEALLPSVLIKLSISNRIINEMFSGNTNAYTINNSLIWWACALSFRIREESIEAVALVIVNVLQLVQVIADTVIHIIVKSGMNWALAMLRNRVQDKVRLATANFSAR